MSQRMAMPTGLGSITGTITGIDVLPAPRSGGKPQKWEVTQADLNMYSLITGHAPSQAERSAALAGGPDETPTESDAGGDGEEVQKSNPVAAPTRASVVRAVSSRGWSPTVLCSYLLDVCSGGFNLNVKRPEVSAWVRRVSGEARKRLEESQTRLGAARAKQPRALTSRGGVGE